MIDQPLAMNPFVDIHVHPAPDGHPIDVARIETITVRCPVRGRGLLISNLTSARDPELFTFFISVVARSGQLEIDSDAPLVPELGRIGFLVTDDQVVDWPQFAIRLDDTLDDDVRVAGASGPASWLVSPSFLFQPSFALHPGVRWPADYDEQDGRLRCFASGPAFWVGDPAELVSPYWVTADAAAHLAALVPGSPPPPLPPALARALARAGALVPADRLGPAPLARLAPSPLARPTPSPLARFARDHAAYEADGYVIARDLLLPIELAALRRYYTALLAAGLVPLGDHQSATRFSIYNDPIGRFLHTRLTGAMSAVVGQPVLPSFSYFFSYIEGASLERHKDRAQAEFSISLQLDHTPTPAAETHWPLWFSFDDGRRAAANLRIGDAVLYHGRAITHHRRTLPAGQRSTILVLEYVPHDFRGLLI
jgi:hypothetical protein